MASKQPTNLFSEPEMTSDRLDKLEELLSHQNAVIDDLSGVVASQSDQIDRLNQRVKLLMTRAAEQETDSAFGEPSVNQKPPHW